MFHGFGKLSYSTGDMREGLFEYDNYRENRLDIKSYNPDEDKIARHCEFYNYYTLVKKIKKPFDQDVADEMNELLQQDLRSEDEKQLQEEEEKEEKTSDDQTDSVEFEKQLKQELEEEKKLIEEEQSPSLPDTDSEKYFGKSEYETDSEVREARKKEALTALNNSTNKLEFINKANGLVK